MIVTSSLPSVYIMHLAEHVAKVELMAVFSTDLFDILYIGKHPFNLLE
jgi:hypothetical protein